MQSVSELARAKINLSLEVLGRRADGLHELRSIVAFADIGDRLKISSADRNSLVVSGPFAADVPRDEANIIWKAWKHLRALIKIPMVSIELEKNLPVAAGMGGGSADAAAMLRGLLQLGGKRLNDAQVRDLAAIGADVPACFIGKACIMQGMGEKISVLTDKLPAAIVLVNPGVACETAAVFKAMGLAAGETRPVASVAAWRNDMTDAAISVQPAIAEVLNALGETALQSPLMSGSGATCFGRAASIELAQQEAQKIALSHPQWWVKAVLLS